MNPASEYIIDSIKDGDKRTFVAWNFFWVGFLIYTISFCIPGVYFSLKYIQPLQILGISLFIPSGFYLIRWSFDSNYLKVLFLLYISWSILTVIRGLSADYEFLKTMLFDAPFSIFIYLAPLILLFKDIYSNLKKIITVILVLNIVYLLYTILFYRIVIYGMSGYFRLPAWITEIFSHFLSFPAAFLVLTYMYHKKWKPFFALIILVLTFLIVTIRARRGLMFMTVCFMFTSYLLFYFTNKGKILKIILSIGIFAFVVFYSYVTYTRNQYGTFGLITSRIDEDTRKGVEDYFYAGMSTTELIIGRGANGLYYCPGIEEQQDNVTVLRSVIETGYLQIVLKSGFIGLALYLLITIPAIFKGLFFSSNALAKASAIWILLYTIFLYPTYVNMFSLTYLLIWISVKICYDPNIRLRSNEEIKKLFQ